MERLNQSFFERPTLIVAQELLGKYIIRKYKGKLLSGKIVETEAYIGPKDKAAHSYKNKITWRNIVEYLQGGYIYIYLVYGMYWQLNITTEKRGVPTCVLIRAIRINHSRSSLVDGPGKVCQYLKLNNSFYGENLNESQRIWLENRGEDIKKEDILATKRIGIEYAGNYWKNKKWRFIIKSEYPFLPKIK